MTAVAIHRAPRRNAARESVKSDELSHRTRQLLNREIDFIPNAAFRSLDADEECGLEEALKSASKTIDAPAGLPAHLRRMCEASLLSREQEQALFRRMNYLKYQADAVRTRLDPDRPDARALDKINELLSEAQSVRDHIIRTNMRLVMAIVKKFVTPRHSFDDLLSEGTYTLMKAVDKFDYGRGFRFSTYAYRSIARNAYRTITSAQKEESRFARDAEELASEQEEDLGSAMMRDQRWSRLRTLTASMLEQLDRRERFIIRSRYALGAHRKVRTFQCLADKLGVSKERVRQLEHRALTKLQAMAAKMDVDDMVGLSVA